MLGDSFLDTLYAFLSLFLADSYKCTRKSDRRTYLVLVVHKESKPGANLLISKTSVNSTFECMIK